MAYGDFFSSNGGEKHSMNEKMDRIRDLLEAHLLASWCEFSVSSNEVLIHGLFTRKFCTSNINKYVKCI